MGAAESPGSAELAGLRSRSRRRRLLPRRVPPVAELRPRVFWKPENAQSISEWGWGAEGPAPMPIYKLLGVSSFPGVVARRPETGCLSSRDVGQDAVGALDCDRGQERPQARRREPSPGGQDGDGNIQESAAVASWAVRGRGGLCRQKLATARRWSGRPLTLWGRRLWVSGYEDTGLEWGQAGFVHDEGSVA